MLLCGVWRLCLFVLNLLCVRCDWEAWYWCCPVCCTPGCTSVRTDEWSVWGCQTDGYLLFCYSYPAHATWGNTPLLFTSRKTLVATIISCSRRLFQDLPKGNYQTGNISHSQVVIVRLLTLGCFRTWKKREQICAVIWSTPASKMKAAT